MSNSKNRGSRRATREALVKFIYANEFSEESFETFLKGLDDTPEGDINKEYLCEVYNGIKEHKDEIDKLIGEHSDNRILERIAKIDLAILRTAVYEMLYLDDIPDSVSINEAVEIGKKYSHDDAGSFINGILGSIQRES